MVGVNLTDEPIRLDSLVGESSIARMGNLFETLDPSQRTTFLETLITEFNGLFDMDLQWQRYVGENYTAFLQQFDQHVNNALESPDYEFNSSITIVMMMMLVEDQTNVFKSFASDLAEVLFLEGYDTRIPFSLDRDEQTHYMQRLYLGYAVRARQLDEIFGELTKPYCVDECPSKPIRCCDFKVQRLFVFPPGLAELMDFDSRRRENLKSSGDTCRYNDSSYGCSLNLFRQPLCISHICGDLEGFLKSKYDNGIVQRFYNNLDLLGQELFSSYKILEYMDKAIQAGRQLIQTD
jgi:hypothetical protein